MKIEDILPKYGWLTEEEMVRRHKEKIIQLYESLEKSESGDTLVRLLTKANIPFKENTDILFAIPCNLTDVQASRLKQILQIVGWFVCYPNFNDVDEWFTDKYYSRRGEKIKDSKNKTLILEQLIIEPKYSVRITNLPKVLYHVTKRVYRNSIENGGLRPKSGGKIAHHPERLYMAASPMDALNIYENMSYLRKKEKLLPNNGLSNLNRPPEEEGFDCWKVNSSDVNNLQWFGDPNYINQDGSFRGLYTLEPINRYLVKLVLPDEMVQLFGTQMDENFIKLYEKDFNLY